MPQKIDPNITRICKICGESFHPTARKQFCCNKPKTRRCVICGKPFDITCNTEYKDKQTCSPTCSAKLRKSTLQNKSKEAIRLCKWCGKPFHPKTPRDVYCHNSHYKKCVICGKEFEIDVRVNPEVKTCSLECKNKLSLQNRDLVEEHKHLVSTLQSKYGVDNAMKIPTTIDNIKKTNQIKYGKDWYTQTDEYKDKVKATSNDRYGVDHFLSNCLVIDKRKNTCLQRYGVDNVSKTDSVKDKIKDVWKDKYGLTNVSQQHISNIEDWQSFQSDPRVYILNNFDHNPSLIELSSHFGVCLTSIYNNVDLSHNSDIISRCSSKMENELIDLIHQIDSNLHVEIHNRSIIRPYELDIYIPELRLAFECNPTSTHNSSIPDPWGQSCKSENYHKVKSQMCEERGVRLIHIFGYEWNHKRKILESIIVNALKSTPVKIHGRNCVVCEISDKDCHTFLNDNHRQGYSSSAVRLGLHYQNELVSVMTFSKPRMSISSSTDSNIQYELVRFCNKLNTSVVGGASKLFKYFVQNYSPSKIVSYSDYARTSGNLYSMLGFSYVRLSQPGYVWVDTRNDTAYNRMNAQKSNISRFLNDDKIDLSMTENDIMVSHGYVKVYDSGSKVWLWSNR